MNGTAETVSTHFMVIKSFQQVILDKGGPPPLVICDIDHTFLKCSYNLDYFRQLTKQDSMFVMDVGKFDVNYDQEAVQLMLRAYSMGFVTQTDPHGFAQLLDRVERLGGKVMFLTARGIIYHEKTINDLKTAGLSNPERFDIHYTNGDMTKGEYLKCTKLLDGRACQNVAFIDDYPSYIQSVHQQFPWVRCYLFKYDC